jgi:hypothetical protein
MKGSTTRRRFFGGAAMLAAPLAAGAAASDDLAARLAALEDANAIRALLRRFVEGINAHARAAPEIHVRSVSLDADATVDVATNGSARAQVLCTVETATPIADDSTLVQMARLQGEGVIRRSERRVLDCSFAKHDGIWILERTELTA